jgi:hypothetical protein
LEATSAPSSNPWLPTEPWALFIKGEKQTHVDKHAIMEAVTLPPLLAYWEKKARYSPEAHDLIDWTANQKAMRQSPDGLRRWVSKHATGMCGVGKFLFLWGKESSDACPLCGLPETARHVPLCRDPRAVEEWNERFHELSQWMTKNHTDPNIQNALSDLLSRWRHFQPPSNLYSPSVTRAVAHQRRIGIPCLLEGLLATDWAILQQQYYESTGSRRSGHRWAALFTAQLWTMGHHLWEYRNDISHSSENIQHKKDEAGIDHKVRAAYAAGPADLPVAAHHLFLMPLTQRLAQTLPEKQRWVALIELELNAHRRALRRLRLQRRRFEAYFERQSGLQDS